VSLHLALGCPSIFLVLIGLLDSRPLASFFPLENRLPPRTQSKFAYEADVEARLDKVQESLKRVDINPKGPRFGSAHVHYRETADLDETAKAFYDKAGMSPMLVL
jgi:hypothetical protein